MMIDLQPHPEGTVLPVRASAGARANAVRGEQEGMLRVSVTQAPEKGKANKAMIEVLSKRLGLPRSRFSLISGETSKHKKFLVRSISPEKLSSIIEGILES